MQLKKREGFAQRVLTDKEWSVLPVSKVADRSSIWLVVGQLKRLSQRLWERGIGKLGFQDLEVLNDEKGAPYFSKSPFSGNVWLSISHTEHFVTASVILEENHEN